MTTTNTTENTITFIPMEVKLALLADSDIRCPDDFDIEVEVPAAADGKVPELFSDLYKAYSETVVQNESKAAAIKAAAAKAEKPKTESKPEPLAEDTVFAVYQQPFGSGEGTFFDVSLKELLQNSLKDGFTIHLTKYNAESDYDKVFPVVEVRENNVVNVCLPMLGAHSSAFGSVYIRDAYRRSMFNRIISDLNKYSKIHFWRSFKTFWSDLKCVEFFHIGNGFDGMTVLAKAEILVEHIFEDFKTFKAEPDVFLKKHERKIDSLKNSIKMLEEKLAARKAKEEAKAAEKAKAETSSEAEEVKTTETTATQPEQTEQSNEVKEDGKPESAEATTGETSENHNPIDSEVAGRENSSEEEKSDAEGLNQAQKELDLTVNPNNVNLTKPWIVGKDKIAVASFENKKQAQKWVKDNGGIDAGYNWYKNFTQG